MLTSNKRVISIGSIQKKDCVLFSGWLLHSRLSSCIFVIVLWKNFLSDQSYLFFPLCFLLTEYLIQVDLEEEKESQEISALQEFEREDVRAKTVPQLLEMLSRPGQMPFYYCGGFEILSQAVTECGFSFERSFTKSSLSSNLFVLPNPLHWPTYFLLLWLMWPLSQEG